MAWLVNAVDITASASTDGVTAATRGSGSGTTSSTVSPTSNSTGMTSVSSTCSPLRSANRSSVAACAANIAPGAPAPGRGVNVPGGNEVLTGPPRLPCPWSCPRWPRFRSRAQLPAGQLQEHVFETPPGDLHVVGQRALCRAPAGDRREHRRVDPALHDVPAGERLRRPVAGGERRGQTGHVHPGTGAEPQLLVAAGGEGG